METRLLTYFISVAQTGNFTKAAAQLHVTQPTLSRQIQDLETQLDTVLFDRSTRRHLTLTKAGVLFEQRARMLLALWEQTENDVKQEENAMIGKLRFGCVEGAISLLMAQWLQAFQQDYPQVAFDLYSADGDLLKEQVDQGLLDFAFLIEPIEAAKYNYIPLAPKERLGVIMRHDDPLANQHAIQLADLYKLPLILPQRTIMRDEITDVLKLDINRLNVKGTANLSSNTMPLIKGGKYYLLSIEGLLQLRPDQHLIFVPIEPANSTGYLLIWRKNHQLSPIAEKFIQYIATKA